HYYAHAHRFWASRGGRLREARISIGARKVVWAAARGWCPARARLRRLLRDCRAGRPRRATPHQEPVRVDGRPIRDAKELQLVLTVERVDERLAPLDDIGIVGIGERHRRTVAELPHRERTVEVLRGRSGAAWLAMVRTESDDMRVVGSNDEMNPELRRTIDAAL